MRVFLQEQTESSTKPLCHHGWPDAATATKRRPRLLFHAIGLLVPLSSTMIPLRQKQLLCSIALLSMASLALAQRTEPLRHDDYPGARQGTGTQQKDIRPSETPRIRRLIALAAELEAEGAANEVRLVLAELGSDAPISSVAPKKDAPLKKAHAASVGARLARGVVSFYRKFIGPAIGSRCVLEPSCSRYFLEASRKHGLLGLPMVADRFVREPAASAPDRPWVQTTSGQWRHPDPVSDHDWWFGGQAHRR